jgi:aromatic ring-cleaving dioxygenase
MYQRAWVSGKEDIPAISAYAPDYDTAVTTAQTLTGALCAYLQAHSAALDTLHHAITATADADHPTSRAALGYIHEPDHTEKTPA